MKKRLLTIIGVLLMAAALFTVIHYIWSDFYISEFNSDDAEIAIWSQATIESGYLLDPDYSYYGVLLPVAGNLFFAPFIKAFGMGITALRAGYSVLAVVFSALLVLALRACLDSWDLSMIGCGLIMICTTASEPLRDIYWAIMVYYSLSSFVILMCIGSLGLCLRGKRVLGGILFFLSALLGSINGNVVLLYSVLPLAVALFLESINQERLSEGFMKDPVLLICAAIVLGIGINKGITAGIQTPYADNHKVLSAAVQWTDNFRALPERWYGIFLELPAENEPVAKKIVLRLGTTFVLSVLPFFSFSMLNNTKSRLTRVVVLYHWTLCAVMMFLFVFGVISNSSNRLIPLWFSCMILDWLTMMWMVKGKGFPQTVGAASACLLALFAGLTAVSVPRQPGNSSVWSRPDCVYQTLLDHGLTQGYSTDFWYGHSVTALSNEEIVSRVITLTKDGFKIPEFQTKSAWYKGYSSDEKTFLICWEYSLDENPWLEEGAIEKYYAWQYTPAFHRTEGYYILVYDHDVIAEKMQ